MSPFVFNSKQGLTLVSKYCRVEFCLRWGFLGCCMGYWWQVVNAKDMHVKGGSYSVYDLNEKSTPHGGVLKT